MIYPRKNHKKQLRKPGKNTEIKTGINHGKKTNETSWRLKSKTRTNKGVKLKMRNKGF